MSNQNTRSTVGVKEQAGYSNSQSPQKRLRGRPQRTQNQTCLLLLQKINN
jgi:hypothetical protein